MIKWIKGANIHDDKALSEGYRIDNKSIVSVLNADNIMKVIESYVRFYSKHNFFFFIEVPCNAYDEEKLILEDGKLHKDVYYLDNIWDHEVLQYLELFEEILVNDGLTAFGIGNHESEIGKYNYNMISVFSENPEKLKEIFDENGVEERNDLLTPWDIINENNPGERSRYKDDEGRTVNDIIAVLEEVGLYKAETREDT